MHRLLPALALALSLSTGWWDAVINATAKALGHNAPSTIEQPTPPHPPTTDGGCSWDPWGGCPGG